MQNKIDKVNTTHTKTKHTLKIILTILTLSSALIGCASTNRTNEKLSNILEKEVTLLEKLKVERSEPSIKAAIQKDPVLESAEAHLLLSIDELIQANKKIQTSFLNETNNKGDVNGN